MDQSGKVDKEVDRIVSNKKKEIKGKRNLLKERIELKKESRLSEINEDTMNKIENRIKAIEDEIGQEELEDSIKEIVETIQGLGGGKTSLDGNGRQQLWKLLKSKYPKNPPSIPVGKKDRSGNMITNHIGLKNLYVQTYKHRLRNRPMNPDFEEIFNLKTDLFNNRLKISEMRKSDPWEMKHLDLALNGLQKDKARDPNGWINDIFKDGVARKNLKNSMLMLFNRMKFENIIPVFVRLAVVATINKGKG